MSPRQIVETQDNENQFGPFLLAVVIFVVGVAVSLAFTGLPH